MTGTFTGQISYQLVILLSSFEYSRCVFRIKDHASPPFPFGKVHKSNVTYNMTVDIFKLIPSKYQYMGWNQITYMYWKIVMLETGCCGTLKRFFSSTSSSVSQLIIYWKTSAISSARGLLLQRRSKQSYEKERNNFRYIPISPLDNMHTLE